MYGGTVKTYQLSREGQYGQLLKVVPVTTIDKFNELTCFQINGTSDSRVEPQPILPDCNNFSSAGETFFVE